MKKDAIRHLGAADSAVFTGDLMDGTNYQQQFAVPVYLGLIGYGDE